MSDLGVTVEQRAPADWDRSLLEAECGSLRLYHTSAWAERLSRVLPVEPRFITVKRGGAPILRVTAFRARARSGQGVMRSVAGVLRALVGGGGRGLQWYGEPAMLGPAEEGPPRTAWALLARSLEEQKRRDRRWRLGGPWPAAQSTALPAAWRASPSATLKVDLGAGLDSIFAAFKPAARKAIRRAERDGITTRRVDSPAELERYTEFAMACAARYGKRNVARADYHLCWQLLRTPPCHFETFYAEHAGETIAGLSVWGFGREIGELGSFQSERAFLEKLYGPDLLKWRVIQWAREEGLGAYDLAGVHPTCADGKEASIRRFKEKWGGSRYDNLLVQG